MTAVFFCKSGDFAEWHGVYFLYSTYFTSISVLL